MRTVDPRLPNLAEALVGRDPELGMIGSFLDRTAERGEALLLSGEPGVGKSALLDAAADMAAGTRTLRAAGVEFETNVSFSGLNQVLLPLLDELESLGRVHRDALSVALGFGDGPPADRLVVSTAALELLRQAARERPLLVVVDDLHWLDRSSAAVLGFVARRVVRSRVGFLGASRPEAESFFDRGGLPEHEVLPLGEVDAIELVGARFPELQPRVLNRVLAEGRGNPLALLELPAALTDVHGVSPRVFSAVLPHSRRLQTLFASRISDLPPATRHLLLLAALDGTGDLGVLRSAARGPAGLRNLEPAEERRLVRVDDQARRVIFSHPLARSAVVELSSGSDRRDAHRMLAGALMDQPDRRAWHLADAAVEPDEEIASLLEQTAQRVRRRGDAVGAVSALLRAADLSPGGPDRGRRLAEAAYVGANLTGELLDVSQRLIAARRADPDPDGSLQAAAAAAYLLMNGDGDVDTAHRLLVGAIRAKAGSYDADDRALTEAIYTLALVCFFGGRLELWEPLYDAIANLKPRVPCVLHAITRTFQDPARNAAAGLGALETLIDGLTDEVDPARIVRVGLAALYVDRLAGCREAFWRVIEDGRQGGAVTAAINASVFLGFDDFLAGHWDEAEEHAGEALELCGSHGYRLLSWPGRYCLALLAAARGDREAVRDASDDMTRWAAPRRAWAIRHYALHARALAALGAGDFEDAYRQAAAISPPGILASHLPIALWVALDLVEAAVRTERRAEAQAHVAAMRDADVAGLSSRLALVAGGAAAIAAPDDDAVDLFEETLAVPATQRWTFDRARVQLAYGERLRRLQAIAEARAQLGAAHDAFEHLGARPWATQALNELRATGQTETAADEPGRPSLTPQEREIAELAATGLTNKQIGQRLFLSHRTVGAHLYRVFPKLAISSRAALRDALSSLPPAEADDDRP